MSEDSDRLDTNWLYKLVKDFGPTIVAAFFAAYTRNSPLLFGLSLAALVAVSLIAAIPWLTTLWRKWAERRQDARVLAEALPKFKDLVRRYGRIINTGTSDSLHYVVVNGLSASHLRDTLLPRLGTPSTELWSNLWTFLYERVERRKKTIPEFIAELQEFSHMVSAYTNLCVSQVFDRLPQDIRRQLTEEDKSALNAFHIRHTYFINEYEAFLQNLSTLRPSLQNVPSYLSRCRPL